MAVFDRLRQLLVAEICGVAARVELPSAEVYGVSESNEPAGASISGLFIPSSVTFLVFGELLCYPVRLACRNLAIELVARRVLKILLNA